MQGNSGEVILMTLLGGAGTFLGPVVGSGIVVTLQDVLSDRVGSWVTVIIGGIFVVCVLAFRKGVVGEILAFIDRRRVRRPAENVVAAPPQSGSTSESAARSNA
jgi:branched-chain amino acid transport system permease protein